MKAEYLNCVMAGVLDVMHQCFHVECKKGKPYVYHYDINLNHLSAVIRMAGDKKGAFVIALSEDDAKKMADTFELFLGNNVQIRREYIEEHGHEYLEYLDLD